MGDRSGIEWTDATWNCIRARNLKTGKVGWHCEHATTGCEFCYAEGFNMRLGTGLPFKPGHRKDIEIFLDDDFLQLPLKWKKPRKIFAFSMTDPFADFVTDEMLDKIFGVMGACDDQGIDHDFQILTKRAERMRHYVSTRGHKAWNSRRLGSEAWPARNVWLGVSCERQEEADARIPLLLQTPAAVRFISAEPLLGPIDARRWMSNCYECGASCGLRLPDRPSVERCERCGEECDETTEPVISEGCPKCGGELEAVCPSCGHYMVYQHPDTPNLDWVIAGGESGPKARPMHPDWPRALRDQCKAADVAFHFKQWGEFHPSDQHDPAQCKQDKTPDAIHVSGKREFLPSEQFRLIGGRVEGWAGMCRVGKAKAGRLLDGVEHNEFPKVRG